MITSQTGNVAKMTGALADRLFPSKYGYFDRATSEYVVTDVLTPRPWVNVLANGEYGAVVSQAGGGFSWADNCQLYRLTRWEQDLAVDAYGRWLYVADTQSKEIWSTTLNPDRKVRNDQVRHGIGYTVYEREHSGVRTKQTVFVPQDGRCEIWILELMETSGKDRELRLGSFLEWQLGSIGEWHREFWRLFVSTEAKGDTLLAWKRRGLSEGTREAPESPLCAYVRVVGTDTAEWFADKQQYLGRAGRLDAPEAILADSKPEVTGRWDDPIAGLRASLRLKAGESRTVCFTVGYATSADEAMANASPLSESWAKSQLRQRIAALSDVCGSLCIKTGSDELDLLVNSWLPNQAYVGRMLARCAYYQQGGAYGFRDQLQDSLMFVDTDPARTLAQIGHHAEVMFEDGGVMHWWHPGTTSGVDSHHSDTCMWLAYATLDYVDETGDLACLNAMYHYLSRATRTRGSEGSLLDHCLRGIDRILSKLSPRGLPLLGAGDWNDGLSHAGLDGKGESVWDAMFLFAILERMAPLLRTLGQPSKAEDYEAAAIRLKGAVEAHGWDGQWYIAGTDDTGRPFGSQTRPEGSIFLNPQTWAVITGVAEPARSTAAMNAVRERLLRPYGALLLAPAYHDVDPFVGYITRYAPGLRENGGVYSHASTWAIEAFVRTGDVESAWSVFQGMCPPLRSELDADRYAAEPFVTPGNVDGPDSPFEGKGGWTWYTGSASWLRRTALHWILGVRGTSEGLVVDPALPSAIHNFSLKRPYRGDIYEIEVSGHGPYQCTVDGESWTGPIPCSGQNRTRKVRLTSAE